LAKVSAPAPHSPLDDKPEAELLEWLADMILIRKFEEVADAQSLRGRVPGGMHPAIGQEAVAVGVMRALAADDVIAGTHRSHHHALAKGLRPDAVMAELFGKATGSDGGRGGSMHLADFDKGLWGSNGIVGGGLGIAMGAALGAQQLGIPRVSVGFFGDGGANTGRVWEFVNLAAVWHLPLIAICENNLYAVETPSKTVTGGESVADRALGFGLPAEQVDGQDVVAVYEATSRAAARARAGDGASFLEILTYRYRGHNSGEVVTYRTEDEVEQWRTSKDPIEQFAAVLTDRGVLTAERLADLNSQADATVAAALQFAEESECSDLSTASENVSVWNNWNGAQR
jgi:TPP-dependent pyruvate/acetoin dehydrogenase alpha subunit